MSTATGIEWTEATWNPWRGCTRVSPGCAHCYMFREQTRYGNDPEQIVRSKTTFDDPLRWTAPKRIFTCSWSDWFHEAADPWRDEAWDIIRRTPHHTYQILTKRPERIADHLPPDWGTGYPNVWLGTSVELQRWVSRVDLLCGVPAALRFLSCEPLLGSLDLARGPEGADRLAHIGWVIAGGESGPRHRPMELAWARALRDQCVAHGIPFFLKQLGGWPDKRGGAAALLDGRAWTETPPGWALGAARGAERPFPLPVTPGRRHDGAQGSLPF